jgi:hypothetical protein
MRYVIRENEKLHLTYTHFVPTNSFTRHPPIFLPATTYNECNYQQQAAAASEAI